MQPPSSATTVKSKSKSTAANESITFRLDRHVLSKLRLEAKQKQGSINVLMNQIAKQHIDWHFNAAQAGFISVRRGLIIKLLEEIKDDEKIKEIAKEVARGSNKDFLLLLRRQYDIASALDFIESWMRVSGYPYHHDVSGSNSSIHQFILQHDMGIKWSKYMAEIYKNLFEEFNITDIQFDLTDNTVAFVVNTDRA